MEETSLEIVSNQTRKILSSVKCHTIRRGHRQFAKSVKVKTGDVTFSCIVNAYTHTTLYEVPFDVFEFEGFRSFKEALDILRIFYPEMTPESPVTIVEFRLAL